MRRGKGKVVGRWLRMIGLCLMSFIVSHYLSFNSIEKSLLLGKQTSMVFAQSEAVSSCANISEPLTEEESRWARTAWAYFVNNYQPDTGFINSANDFPSATTWDMGNYLMALNAVRWLNLIDQGDFDARLNKFLETISSMRLFEDSLPHKVYSTISTEFVDYGNNPVPGGIGWSALDIGRLLASFHLLRTCHPQYADWIESIVSRWDVERIIQNDRLYGAGVSRNGQTLLVQEGRLGYEQYSARGFQLWGYEAPMALSFEPFNLVEIYGVQIPADTRDFQRTNGNNYVVSESYILDGLEFGFLGTQMQEYARNILEVQRRRYLATGQLTAVTEDNVLTEDKDPNVPSFLYNSIYANGNAWVTITEENQQYPRWRTVSTKAALGLHYLFPQSEYGQQLRAFAGGMMSPDGGGFYAGRFEEDGTNNIILTANTNGLILEMLYYKARGDRPLLRNSMVSTSRGNPEGIKIMTDYPSPVAVAGAIGGTADVEPIAVVEGDFGGSCHPINGIGSDEETRQIAQRAWNYFESHYEPSTGLVRDRTDVPATSLWGMGDYLMALQAAESLDIISPEIFDDRVRMFLGALQQLPLFAGELPHRGYNVRTLQPVDYANNTLSGIGNGWSGLDIGRLLIALHDLKSCYPRYTQSIDSTLLHWSYLRVIQDQKVHSAIALKTENQNLTRVYPNNFIGYQEIAEKGFQLWGFDINNSNRQYRKIDVEGISLPIAPQTSINNTLPENNRLISSPLLQYGLYFGLDTPLKPYLEGVLKAEHQRYQRTGRLSASDTSLVTNAPHVIHSTIIGDNNQPWAVLSDQNPLSPDQRIVSSASAFAYYALFPNDDYARQLRMAIKDAYDNNRGYSEGIREINGEKVNGFSAKTNSLILQSLLYHLSDQQSTFVNNFNLDSPWWNAIRERKQGSGLPRTPRPRIIDN
ncbi:hypothetical protein Cyast_1338 [Cyanobacterium stanieri PCC 7202]|uniref:DUF3131 domain-containing protein n=1 Tax=Cyanobacterium stanieri (strain ATCC 29140 / PCC 7202) TaxID=292563 RepID=K9YMH9_CYASC|nr:hypothetical protein Cyast_1338 [Cyanobacterium stanieri PCC 7202]